MAVVGWLRVMLAAAWSGGLAEWHECPPSCSTPEELLLERFIKSEYGQNDIAEHLSTLRLYASRVASVAELGVQWGHSTWALLQGLQDSGERGPKVHRAYDIAPFPHQDEAERLAAGIGVDYSFQRANVLEIGLEETDLLFVDTFHAYPHLRAELRRHAAKARRFILMHDTTVDANFSECVRLEAKWSERGMNCDTIAEDMAFSPDEVRVGLWPAVQEFLATRPEWRLVRRFTHNNGLTILERVSANARQTPECPLNVELGISQALEEHDRLVKEATTQPTAWALARLGVALAFFVAPLLGKPSDAQVSARANEYLAAALSMDPEQPQAHLARGQVLCPRWAEELREGGIHGAACLDEASAALAEEHFRVAAQGHDLWEAHLAVAALSARRGAAAEATVSRRAALRLQPGRPQLGALPLSDPFWRDVLCYGVVS